MSADLSAYAVLGLEPGADRAAVDAAYRKLIKRYHPDRKGGNAKRAAEINRAYSELRDRPEQERHKEVPIDIAEAIYARRARHLRKIKKPPRLWPPLLLLAAIAVGIIEHRRVEDLIWRVQDGFHKLTKPPASYGTGARVERSTGIDEPLHDTIIAGAVTEAERLARKRNPELLAEHSRDCHREMRSEPDAAVLDRCAAYDMAVVVISRGDPMQDDGPFSSSAVTARQMAAARLLTDDYNSIEARLDQIRSRVEAALAVPPPEVD
jgi:hypothetical protein